MDELFLFIKIEWYNIFYNIHYNIFEVHVHCCFRVKRDDRMERRIRRDSVDRESSKESERKILDQKEFCNQTDYSNRLIPIFPFFPFFLLFLSLFPFHSVSKILYPFSQTRFLLHLYTCARQHRFFIHGINRKTRRALFRGWEARIIFYFYLRSSHVAFCTL